VWSFPGVYCYSGASLSVIVVPNGELAETVCPSTDNDKQLMSFKIGVCKVELALLAIFLCNVEGMHIFVSFFMRHLCLSLHHIPPLKSYVSMKQTHIIEQYDNDWSFKARLLYIDSEFFLVNLLCLPNIPKDMLLVLDAFPYTRFLSLAATFLSHFQLWKGFQRWRSWLKLVKERLHHHKHDISISCQVSLIW